MIPAFFAPSSLYSVIIGAFSGGAPGWLYDDTNQSTLFQDAAGTTPVTALEQPVGLQLDLSGRGNHRYQPTSANRPTWSARYSSFTKTEALGHSDWVKYESTVDSTKYTAPDGTLTAQKLLATTANNNHYIQQAVTVGGNGVLTFYAAPGGYNYCSIASNPNGYIHFDLTNGNVSTLGAGWASATCVAQANGFYKITVTASAPQTWGNAIIYIDSTWIPSGATGPWSGAGDVTKGILLWHPDLRPSDQATGLIPTYQRVNTATDYDSVGFPAGLRWNGSNSWMQNASVDFSGTNKVSVFVGVRKLSDAASGAVCELGASADANNASWALFGPSSGGSTNFAFYSRGTVQQGVTPTGYAAPITKVLAGLGDISAPQCALRVNGVQAATTSASQGTGNYGNYPAYFGARAGSSLFFNGLTFSSIAIGIALSASQIAAFESWSNSKCRAY